MIFFPSRAKQVNYKYKVHMRETKVQAKTGRKTLRGEMRPDSAIRGTPCEGPGQTQILVIRLEKTNPHLYIPPRTTQVPHGSNCEV